MRRQLCDEHVAAENQAAHLEDASSFDQLVGDGEHAWGHFDAESPRCLNVDDKLEVCRLQHWQIGGPYPVENAAGVDADLTTHVEVGQFHNSSARQLRHSPSACKQLASLKNLIKQIDDDAFLHKTPVLMS